MMLIKLLHAFTVAFVLNIASPSFAQDVAEHNDTCSIKIPMPKEENDEQNLKVHYIIQFLSYKIEKVPDFIIRQGKRAHMEFNMDKNCREILQMILERL